MPTPAEVRAQLTDILVAVVDCRPDQVTDDARLEDLGVDSLAAVEVADELGRRFGVHLADETVDSVVTVADAVRAVVAPPAVTSRRAARRTPVAPAAVVAEEAPPVRERSTGGFVARADAFWRLATWFVVAGVVIGGVIGFGGAAVVRATGLGGVDLPPIVSATSPSPSASATPTPSATAPTTPSQEPVEEPTFSVESDQVAAGQRFAISGRFPELSDGEVLQVQVRDPGGEWDDFPVSVQTREGGRFETQIYTSRTGEREFRVLHEGSNTASPGAEVTIG